MLYTPLDEVYWREDQAIKSSPNDQVLSQKIALARELRRQHFKEPERGPGGARHAVINAIRHAWLVCHEGSSSVNYARQTDSSGDHCGPLHDFIRSLTELLRTARNDGLHREIRSLDLQIIQLMTVAIRLHDAVTVHGQCERNDMVSLASNLTNLGPGSSIRRYL